ncbi:sodium:solute symporter [Roseivirga sp. UBA1976]|uniref:sodium:solute symporter n=1 Tax=Roseivirga sp. UBA1976 TaxID=1947386 RepID=UPI00257B93A2|nr:sodium:solute symporter [Roseivirga sp. UBA1976]|tara:strand:+ start:8369 stop:10069 length:1701 start_codon:yes stop_codon:yes gene_type:complete
MESIGLELWDKIIIAVYLVGIVIYGIRKGKQESSEDYFLAGRNMAWPIVGISLFAANIGSNTLIGLTSDAFQTNVAVYNYEWMAAVVLVIFGLFFLPFYLKSRVYTMPEFLERRYDTRTRYLFSGITIVGNVIIDTASGLYAGNLILKIIFPDYPSWMIIAFLAVAAAAYTIPGGLSSVVHTEVIQAILLVFGSFLVTYYAFDQVGGWQKMIDGLNNLHTGGLLEKNSDEVLSLIRPNSDEAMPWLGLVLGVPLLGFYFWANNQFMVQRVLSAKDLNHGRWGALFAGLLKLPVLFIMVIPGVLAILLFKDMDISFLNYQIPTEGGFATCENLSDCPNMTYPVLIYKLLPTGILGLVIAGLLAAMSSSISATLNSASTLITMDFTQKLRPNMSSKQLVRAGQIATCVLVVLAAAWAPMIESFQSLWTYLQQILGFISPPIVAAFVVGLFYRRANAQGGFWSLVLSYLLVIGWIIYCFSKYEGISTDATGVHFLYVVPVLFAIAIVLNVGISLATTSPDAQKVSEMIWTSQIYKEETKELAHLPWYKNYRTLSVLLLIATAIIVIWFA